MKTATRFEFLIIAEKGDTIALRSKRTFKTAKQALKSGEALAQNFGFESTIEIEEVQDRPDPNKYFGVVLETSNWDGRPSAYGCPKFETKAEAWAFVKESKRVKKSAVFTVWEYRKDDDEYAEEIWQG